METVCYFFNPWCLASIVNHQNFRILNEMRPNNHKWIQSLYNQSKVVLTLTDILKFLIVNVYKCWFCFNFRHIFYFSKNGFQ